MDEPMDDPIPDVAVGDVLVWVENVTDRGDQLLLYAMKRRYGNGPFIIERITLLSPVTRVNCPTPFVLELSTGGESLRVFDTKGRPTLACAGLNRSWFRLDA